MLKLEMRADGLHLSGYVNVTEKMSRPVLTPKGVKVIEIIEPRAFEKALEKVDNVPLTKDHGDIALAETRAKTLELYEDNIGLHYDATITDQETIDEARAGKIKGLSFKMKNVVDKIEERANDLPLRKISALDLTEVTLAVKKVPVYAATSVEMRAEDPDIEECRAMMWESTSLVESKVIDRYDDEGNSETERTTHETVTRKRYDNTEFKNRIAAISK